MGDSAIALAGGAILKVAGKAAAPLIRRILPKTRPVPKTTKGGEPRVAPTGEPRVAPTGGSPVAANDAPRLGETVSPLGRTYENSDTYLGDVANHYGINLRGVRPVWDHSLGPVTKGLTRQAEGGGIIRINPGFVDEADLANTIAHELSHARDFQKGLSSFEGPATASGNALEEWIYGLR